MKNKMKYIMILVIVFVSGLYSKNALAAEFSDAMNIQVNQPIGDSVESGYNVEQNYYKFNTAQSGNVTIKFLNPLQSNSEQYWRVYLYNSEYKELCFTPVYGNKTSTDSITCGIPAGTYYIMVSSESWGDAKSTDMYTLEAKFSRTDMWEKEFNEEFTTSTYLELNSEYSGTTRGGYNIEKDYYKIQLMESGYLTITFSNPLQSNSDEYWKVYLYNSEYEEVCYISVYGNKESTDLVATGLDKGTYYIKVESSSWDDAASSDIYTINAKFLPSVIWEKELNEDFTSATDISLETEYFGTTWAGYNEEKDFYKFNISKDGFYSVGIKTPNLNDSEKCWEMYLFNSSYEELDKKTIYGNKTYHAISKNLSSGTYYVRVTSTNWGDAASTEKYTLKVVPTTIEEVQATCDHEFECYYVDATYFSKGYTLYTCEKCGYSYKEDYSAKRVLDQGYLYSYCSTGKGKLYLSWSTVSDATGYQIRYSTDKNFNSGVVTKTVKGQYTSKKTISNLARKKKYYVQIRAYIKSGSKTAYGKWSSKRVLKTK